ncbi:tRNA (N6-threonylcarbamoyladenosine(37)-N6)-methyltransferase TrmO, partial [bacterium]|nr:tRNA (N6-threonylcarbamoyladenosine(37)-N6)-methyltransferase TrmO [bacterium]
MEHIGHISSDYKQRFAIPRQPGLSASAVSKVYLDSKYSLDSVKGLDDFTHIWVVFHFHDTKGKGWKEVVRPPRLGGKIGRGVFATRSPFRPNSIGLSVVKLISFYKEEKTKRVVIEVAGGDFLDGTPVFDIKPYVPYADIVSEAKSAWANTPDVVMPVELFEDEVCTTLDVLAKESFEKERKFIFENISLDPRPPHERNKDGKAGQSWGVKLGSFDV